jgi:hypothetical protein
LRWINEELTDEAFKIIGVTTVAELAARLAERANLIAIVDFDAMSEPDLAVLLDVRAARWSGPLIALGRIEAEVRTQLSVREMLVRPFGSERLRKVMSEIRSANSTQVLPAIPAAS